MTAESGEAWIKYLSEHSTQHTDKLWEQKLADGSVNFIFRCPGCGDLHRYTVGKSSTRPNQHSWTFDGNYASPTFTPSLRYLGGGCHLFIKAGMIEFCADSPHKLKSQTVPMIPIERNKA